jgi:hypothetical protein
MIYELKIGKSLKELWQSNLSYQYPADCRPRTKMRPRPKWYGGARISFYVISLGRSKHGQISIGRAKHKKHLIVLFKIIF